ncbi:hypothetical protein [Oleidesulfovibrio sp.]|uniref:hypothetical protein n=1 Tax=Oleidesulfovibrio sp. TaxID=2909707 RepID=UPI003A8C7473
MNSIIPEETIDKIDFFFKQHLLALFIEAAQAACDAVAVDPDNFGEYTLGGAFWDNYFHRASRLKSSDDACADCIHTEQNDLVFSPDGAIFRCHKVDTNYRPRGGQKAKKAAYEICTNVLPGLEEEMLLKRGNMIVAFRLDREWGLEEAVLGVLIPSSSKNAKLAVDFEPLRTLYSRAMSIGSDLPQIDAVATESTTDKLVSSQRFVDENESGAKAPIATKDQSKKVKDE